MSTYGSVSRLEGHLRSLWFSTASVKHISASFFASSFFFSACFFCSAFHVGTHNPNSRHSGMSHHGHSSNSSAASPGSSFSEFAFIRGDGIFSETSKRSGFYIFFAVRFSSRHNLRRQRRLHVLRSLRMFRVLCPNLPCLNSSPHILHLRFHEHSAPSKANRPASFGVADASSCIPAELWRLAWVFCSGTFALRRR